MMEVEGGTAIGGWSDLDGPAVRAALGALGADMLPIRYLDGGDIPPRYKVRRVAGKTVPMSVLAEMERRPSDPWDVRDRAKRNGLARKTAACAKWRRQERGFEKN